MLPRIVGMVCRMLPVSFVWFAVCCPYGLLCVARYRCTIICIAGGQIDSMCTSVDDMGDQKVESILSLIYVQIFFKCLHVSGKTRKDDIEK